MKSSTTRSNRSFTVLLLDEGVFSDRVIACLRACRRARVHVVSSDASTLVRRSSCIETFRYLPDLFSRSDGLEIVLQLARDLEVDVILPTDFGGMSWCARHRNIPRLQMYLPPLSDSVLLESLHDKESLHTHLQSAGLPLARQVTIGPGDDPAAMAADLRFPILLKPVAGRGGEDIVRAETLAGLAALLLHLRLKANRWIAQEIIEGTDRDISLLAEEGRIVASCVQQGIGERRSFHGSDREIEMVRDDILTDQASRLVAAVGFSGLAHLDFRKCEHTGKYVLLDFNPRFWTSLLASLAAGVNFPYLMCQWVLREPFPPADVRQGRFLTDYLPATKILPRLVGIGGERVPLRMVSWRWQMSDPTLQLARLVRTVKLRVTRLMS